MCGSEEVVGSEEEEVSLLSPHPISRTIPNSSSLFYDSPQTFALLVIS